MDSRLKVQDSRASFLGRAAARCSIHVKSHIAREEMCCDVRMIGSIG